MYSDLHNREGGLETTRCFSHFMHCTVYVGAIVCCLARYLAFTSRTKHLTIESAASKTGCACAAVVPSSDLAYGSRLIAAERLEETLSPKLVSRVPY